MHYCACVCVRACVHHGFTHACPKSSIEHRGAITIDKTTYLSTSNMDSHRVTAPRSPRDVPKFAHGLEHAGTLVTPRRDDEVQVSLHDLKHSRLFLDDQKLEQVGLVGRAM